MSLSPRQASASAMRGRVTCSTGAAAAPAVTGLVLSQEAVQRLAGTQLPGGRRVTIKRGRVTPQAGSPAVVQAAGTADLPAHTRAPVRPRRTISAPAQQELGNAAAEAAEAALAARAPKKRAAKRKQPQACDEAELATAASEPGTPAVTRPRRSRRGAAAPAAGLEDDAAAAAEGADAETKPKRTRSKYTGPVYQVPTRESLEGALQQEPPPIAVWPNLGYCCLNMDLAEQRPRRIFTNRDMIKRTFQDKGLPYVSELALQNVSDLKAIVKWNHEHGIRLFRMTSNFFAWCTFYQLEDLPDFPAIADELAFAGRLARAYGQRLTFHPSHFVKLAADNEDLLSRSLQEMEVHSKILDLMGFEPSHWNKINIHIGGVYGDKQTTLDRFAAGFARLSANCKARMTLENDDWASAFSIRDLLPLSKMCGIPLVFDFHHHKFCSGGWTEKEALQAAMATWPPGIRPVVHWSESQEGRRPHAHSDYIHGPMDLHGHEQEVDVQIEAKCKERTLLRFRDEILPRQLAGLIEEQSLQAATPKLAAC